MDKSVHDTIVDNGMDTDLSPAGDKTTDEKEDEERKQSHTPYHMKWVADLIQSTIMGSIVQGHSAFWLPLLLHGLNLARCSQKGQA